MEEVDLEADIFKQKEKTGSGSSNDGVFSSVINYFSPKTNITNNIEKRVDLLHTDPINYMTLQTYRRLSDSDVNDTSIDLSFRLVLIGDSSVGKSSIANRLAGCAFEQYQQPTIGIDFRVVHFHDDVLGKIRLTIWDTAGQERYNSLSKTYYRGADGMLLVYDITNKESFDNINSKWLSQIKMTLNPEDIYEYIVVANKSDLDNARRVSKKSERDLSTMLKCDIVSCSAKNSQKINMEAPMFSLIGKMVTNSVILRRAARKAQETNSKIGLEKHVNKLNKTESSVCSGSCAT